MSEGTVSAMAGQSVEGLLRQELAHAEALLGTIPPILRHLLANDDHSVFSDEIIARVRGMMEHLARQLLDALTEAAGEGERLDHEGLAVTTLVDGLVAHQAFLTHIHALALEWQLTERLQGRLALDPVLSPLLQTLIAAPDGETAGKAVALLAAQARFAQAQRRMEHPLSELPGDLFQVAVLAMHGFAGAEQAEPAERAERALRDRCEPARNRLGLLIQVIGRMGGDAVAALSAPHAGVALFVTALALAAGQDRDLTVLATNEGQVARLAVALRSAGLRPGQVEEQFAALHPDVSLPDGFEQLGADRAAALLSTASRAAGA